jgi:hypothetical protein
MKYLDCDIEEWHAYDWHKHGALYHLTWQYYEYADGYEKVSGRGIRNIYLTITKKWEEKRLHCWEEINIEKLSKRNQEKYEDLARDNEPSYSND